MKKRVRIVILGVGLMMVAYFTGRGIRSWVTEDLVILKNKDTKMYAQEVDDSSYRSDDKKEYTSDLSSEGCKLCGNGKGTLLPVYKGQDNLGIISLNTFDISYIEINRYDDYGRLIEEADKNGSGTHINNMGEDGFMSVVNTNINRGYASASVSMNKEKELDLDKVAANLCETCLNQVMENQWFGDPYGVGLIDFASGEIILFSETIRGFTIGNFYVVCDVKKTGDNDEISDVYMNVFYCPERYQ